MKLVLAIALAGSLGNVDASMKSIRKGYTELIKATKEAGNRNLLTTSIANVNGYGCWCYFDDSVGNGKGVPMDLIDAECRNLHRGYECAVADFGAGCVPWEVTYFPVSGTTFIASEGSVAAACTHVNTVLTSFGPCAAAACAIETEFINEYTTITQTLNPAFETFSHSGAGSFNPGRNCVTNDQGTPDKGERSCCGTFPNRYPFKTYNGASACCQGSIFKVATHKCCGDGSVVLNNASCSS